MAETTIFNKTTIDYNGVDMDYLIVKDSNIIEVHFTKNNSKFYIMPVIEKKVTVPLQMFKDTKDVIAYPKTNIDLLEPVILNIEEESSIPTENTSCLTYEIISQVKQDELEDVGVPSNLGSRNQKVYMVTPTDGHGNQDQYFRYPLDYDADSTDPSVINKRGQPFDKKQYAKRLVTGDGDIGIVMHGNRLQKVQEGLIASTEDSAYKNYADHDEPYVLFDADPEKHRTTIASRDTNGRFIAEPGVQRFHAVTVDQVVRSAAETNKIDYMDLDPETQFGVFYNPYVNTTVYHDLEEASCPVYPSSIVHWYPNENISNSFASLNFNIPSHLANKRFSIGLWLYNNDFRAKKLADGSVEYHTFRIKLGANGKIDSENIALLRVQDTISMNKNCNITVDANIGKWFHITINCNISDEKENIGLLQLGSQVMKAPLDLSMTNGYDYSTGLHYSSPVIVEGKLNWMTHYLNHANESVKVNDVVQGMPAADKIVKYNERGAIQSIAPKNDGDVVILSTLKEEIAKISDIEYAKVDYLEVNPWTGLATNFSQMNGYFLLSNLPTVEDDPFYPTKKIRYTAIPSWDNVQPHIGFAIPAELQGSPFTIGFWLNTSALNTSSGTRPSYRLMLYNGASISYFNTTSSVHLGYTNTAGNNKYIVDAVEGDWCHITVNVQDTNIKEFRVSARVIDANNFIEFSTPVMIKETDIKYPYKTKNKYIDAINNRDYLNNQFVRKTEDALTIINGRALYQMKKETDDKKNLNTWRWSAMYIDNETIFTNVDCEGVVKVVGSADHVGGYHGYERIASFKLFIDGQEIDEAENIDFLSCKEIILLITSNVYAYKSETDIIFDRVKKLVWKDNTLNIYNTWIAKQVVACESLKLSGMLSVNSAGLFGYTCSPGVTYRDGSTVYDEYIDSHTLIPTITTENIPSQAALNEMTFKGDHAFNLTVATTDQDTIGFTELYGTNDNDKRFKVYFNYPNRTLQSGDICKGHCQIIANT